MLTSMNHKMISKSLLMTGLALMLFAQVQVHAAKGDSKAKKSFTLKFNGFDLKGINNSTFFTLKPTLVYKGNFNSTPQTPQQSVITFQKGNTTVIVPFKKPILPKFKAPEAPKFR